MVMDAAIDALRTDFRKSPANYRVEAELAFDLKYKLNSVLSDAEITGENNDGESNHGPDHSEYAEAILSSDRFDRAHCEVSGKDFGMSNTNQIDLIVFEPEVHISLENGVKLFQEEDVQAAVELKYRKDLKYLREDSKKQQEHLEDIERLADGFSHDTDLYYLLFSNYGLLRQNGGTKALEELNNHRDQVTVHYTCPPV